MFLRAITTLSQIFTTTGSTREVPGLLARCYNGDPLCAGVAELVDAPDSKSGSFTGVSVRFRPSVPNGCSYQGMFARSRSKTRPSIFRSVERFLGLLEVSVIHTLYLPFYACFLEVRHNGIR